MEDESNSSDDCIDEDRPEIVRKKKKTGDETESNDEFDFANDSDYENIGLPQWLVEIDLEKYRKKTGLGNIDIWEALQKKEEPKIEEDKLEVSKDKKKKKTIATWTQEEDDQLIKLHEQLKNQWKEI